VSIGGIQSSDFFGFCFLLFCFVFGFCFGFLGLSFPCFVFALLIAPWFLQLSDCRRSALSDVMIEGMSFDLPMS
jgi:hypothetical protein